jgi:hypothetical protein
MTELAPASIRIMLDPHQTSRLLKAAGEWTKAEIDADCESSGYSLIVTVCGPYGCCAAAQIGGDRLELGEVSFELVREPV